MEMSWLLGLIRAKHRDAELDEVLEEFYESMGTEHKREFKKMIKAVALRIDPKEAQEIVRRMEPSSEHWSMEQIRKVLAEKGVHLEKELYYYLVMNMAYNDYRSTADKFGLEPVDFCFSIAHDFIEDPDAKAFKVEKYFM